MKQKAVERKEMYPSIDMPQLQYYTNYPYNPEDGKKNVTAELFRQNMKYPNSTALTYIGNKIPFAEAFKNIYDLIKSLSKNGVKKGDPVAVCLTSMPEADYAFYAAAYLGAKTIQLVPYMQKEAMIADLNKDQCRILIILDVIYDKLKDTIDEVVDKTSLEKVVVLSPLNSTKLSFLAKRAPEGTISYNEFVNEGSDTPLPNICPYEEGLVCAVVYSSGTTGNIKGIELTHLTVNNLPNTYRTFGLDLHPGQVFIDPIPAQAATGLNSCITAPLFHGSNVCHVPKLEPKAFIKAIGRNKADWAVGTIGLYKEGLEECLKSSLFRALLWAGFYDYSHLTNAYIGGTLVTPQDSTEVINLLNQVGCHVSTLPEGYGRCEEGASLTMGKLDLPYHDYSVGIPLPGVKIIAVDENDQELPCGMRGELAVYMEIMDIENIGSYYNRPDLSHREIFNKNDGKKYRLLGDIGMVCDDGVIVVYGRANDVSMVNGVSVYNFDVKIAILQDPDIRDCEVLSRDGVLCADLIFAKSPSDLTAKLQDIQSYLYQRFDGNEAYIPSLFKVRDRFPLASSTKRDYKSLKEEPIDSSFIRIERGMSLYRELNIS